MDNPKIRIMIVEDEALIALDLQIKLKELGYEVTGVAASYGEAIVKVDKMKPHLILMDVYIKGEINGIETAQYMEEIYNIPSLFLTAYQDETTQNNISQLKPVGILTKPFEEAEFEKLMYHFVPNQT